ncbi:AraC family transcriptional regulator [Enterovibrio coralii]|uniref:AraC effector-binding domain-containing protein n=1 Tax=Enterovibrio coralii TaxID=294935 RepID=A0A135I5L2_9GAMM|nr:GyrI-like domain-containing protein [Enterovibrio coralii]KXF80739.1 hypothetical protein ATN88_15735 [Enterovibrio coralii]
MLDIMVLEEATLACVRLQGAYGKGIEEACDTLALWAEKDHFNDGELMIFYHDDPKTTVDAKCRTDVCLIVPIDTQAEKGIEIIPFAGGRFATIKRRISHSLEYRSAWEDLYAFIKDAGFELSKSAAGIELYGSYMPFTKVAEVTFCVPVK